MEWWFHQHHDPMSILANALTERPIKLGFSNFEEISHESVLCLPKIYAQELFTQITPDFDILKNFYICRILQYSICIAEKWILPNQNRISIQDALAIAKHRESEMIEKIRFHTPHFPIDRINALSYWLGPLPTYSERAKPPLASTASQSKGEENSHKIVLSEIDGSTSVLPKITELKPEETNPLTHVFEKVITADDYQGGNKTTDHENELGDHQEAIKDLHFTHIVRTDERSTGFIKSSAIIETGASSDVKVENPDTPTIKLKEWFESENQYREGWCSVFERDLSSTASLSSLPEPQHAQFVRKKLKSFVNLYVRKFRQIDGDELDLDALIRLRCDLSTGRTPDPRIYSHRKKREKDLAIFVLIDTSFSTDSWANNRRILDHIKETGRTLMYSLWDFKHVFAIAGFSSHTRNRIDFSWIKRFSESWENVDQSMIHLQPNGYTRIGPAIRNAMRHLLEQKARRRSLFLIGDGKPSDLDRYEGRHGNRDTSMAITELRAHQIHFKAFVTSQERPQIAAKIFGKNHFLISRDQKSLADGIVDTFLDLMKT